MKKLCTITIDTHHLNDNYIFYSNGMIWHIYDHTIFDCGVMEWVKPGEISDSVKQKILQSCAIDNITRVKRILELNLRMN